MSAGNRINEPVAVWDIPGQLRRIPAMLTAAYYGFRFLLWAAPHRAYPKNILPFSRAVRAELPPGAKLGVVGFCWGGWASTNLCKESAVEGGSEKLIDAQFCGHPYNLKTPDMIIDAVSTYKVPYSMAIGDRDNWLRREAVEQTKAALRQDIGSGGGEGGYNYEIRIYEGCTHGFVVRAKPGDEVETSAAEEARAQAVRWLKTYL
jgi:dienelactone hydrolase